MTTALTNAQLGELLRVEAGEHEEHRRLALERAARASQFWPREAADLARDDRSLTDPPSVPEPEPSRAGYLTYAEVRTVLDADPAWEATPHGDLQVHSTDSDGSL